MYWITTQIRFTPHSFMWLISTMSSRELIGRITNDRPTDLALYCDIYLHSLRVRLSSPWPWGQAVWQSLEYFLFCSFRTYVLFPTSLLVIGGCRQTALIYVPWFRWGNAFPQNLVVVLGKGMSSCCGKVTGVPNIELSVSFVYVLAYFKKVYD